MDMALSQERGIGDMKQGTSRKVHDTGRWGCRLRGSCAWGSGQGKQTVRSRVETGGGHSDQGSVGQHRELG